MKVNQNLELVLDDPATVEALKATDVVPTIKAEATQPYSITLSFSQADVDRLSRLSNGTWEDTIHETIQSLLVERVGRPTISSPSMFSQKVSAPSNGRFV